MSKDIFSGLENLGFEDIDNVNLYKKEDDKMNQDEEKIGQSEEEKQRSLLYDMQVTCPVCDVNFKVRAVKTSASRILKKDSDSFIRYGVINPYFYDAWVCNSCGYSAMKNDFHKIRSFQIDSVKQKITSRWRGKSYPDVYNIDIAIERYKLALLNYVVTEAKSSKKAMNCLKLAWMYRLKEDADNEITFLKQALDGFSDAYYNEDFPIYEMNKFTIMYLIGELNRRAGKPEEALVWFSKIITAPSAPQRLKDKTRDQKDLIEESLKKESASNEDLTEGISFDDENKKDKKGFFSRFFK